MSNSSSSTKTELFRRLATLAGQAVPSFVDPTNTTFGELEGTFPLSDDTSTLSASVAASFDDLLKSIGGGIPSQEAGAMSIGSPREAMEETLNQAKQILSLATPASPVIARLIAALKTRPLNVDLKDGPTGLSTSIPADLGAIRDAANRIAGGVAPTKGPPRPVPMPKTSDAKIVGGPIFQPTLPSFTQSLTVTGGAVPTRFLELGPVNPLMDVRISNAGSGAFQLTAILLDTPPSGVTSFGFTLTPKDGPTDPSGPPGKPTGKPQIFRVDWSAWLAGGGRLPRLTLQGPGPVLAIDAPDPVRELAFEYQTLPSQFTLTVDGSSVAPVWSTQSGVLLVSIDLSFLLASATGPGNLPLRLHVLDRNLQQVTYVDVVVLLLPGSFTLDSAALEADIPITPGAPITVTGANIGPFASAALVLES